MGPQAVTPVNPLGKHGEIRPRREIGGRPEIGKEDFGPLAGRRQHAIGGIAQCFERFGEPHRRERLDRCFRQRSADC